MNFEHHRVAKSLKRVYQLIKQPYTCIYVLHVTLNHYKECIMAPSGNIFWWKFKKCETHSFCPHFFLQYTPNNVYWILGTKNNAYKHQKYFFSDVPKKYGEKSTKNDAKWTSSCSLCVLSVGKAFFLPRLPSKNSALAKVAGNGERRQATPPMKSSFTDDRKQRMWMFFSFEN